MKKSLKRWLVPAFAAAVALAASVPALAAETVNVTVTNVKGGFLRAYYRAEDGTNVYIPVGETARVPKGALLRVNAVELDYWLSDTKSIESFAESVSVNGEALELRPSGNQSWTLTADEDMVFDAVFKGLEKEYSYDGEDIELVFVNPDNNFSTNTGMYEEGALPAKQLTVFDYNSSKSLGFSGVESIDIEYVGYDNNDEYRNMDGVFSIDEKGVLRASENLNKGSYYIEGQFEYKGDEYDLYLSVYVGAAVNVNAPLVKYQYRAGSKSKSQRSISFGKVFVDSISSDTFQQVFDKYNAMELKSVLANHTATGIGKFNGSTEKYTSLMSKKVNEEIKEYYPRTSVFLMYGDYDVPTVPHLEESDIVPENVTPGWNKQGDKWYFYESGDPASLVKNSWLPCPEQDGESVWVGSDGAVVTNGVVKADGTEYLVDAKGHKITDRIVTINGVDYVVDSNGVITEAKLHLATPNDAEEAGSQVDKVLENQDSMSQEDKEKAADMLTEALKSKVDAAELTDEEIAKYEELYKAAFGADNIIVEPSAEAGGIVAAGLTSADFEGGSVRIQYVTEWLGSSSNAQERVSVKLLVNGAERKALTAPVTICVEDMPEEFIASYSNAKYNYEVKDAENVTVDTENGVLKMKIARTGIFEIKAVLKQTSRPSGGKSSSSGSGRATVTANYQKSGKWVLDNVGWWYRYDDGTWPANTWAYLPWKNESKWYYFNADGYMVTGWHYWNHNYYYLYPVADGDRGYMFTGWHEIGGKWYYFSAKNDAFIGAMAYNTTTPDGYRVDENGAWIK